MKSKYVTTGLLLSFFNVLFGYLTHIKVVVRPSGSNVAARGGAGSGKLVTVAEEVVLAVGAVGMAVAKVVVGVAASAVATVEVMAIVAVVVAI